MQMRLCIILIIFSLFPIHLWANQWSDSFECGTFAKWTEVNNDLPHDFFMDVALNLGAIKARSGMFMATTPESPFSVTAIKTFDIAEQGNIAGYICFESFNGTHSSGLGFNASDNNSGAMIIVNANGSGKVCYSLDGGVLITTQIIAEIGVWHEIRFTVDSSGVSGYWDGVSIFSNHDSLTKNVKQIKIGSPWQTSATGYDDISFPAPQYESTHPNLAMVAPTLKIKNKPFFVLGCYDHFSYSSQQSSRYDQRYSAFSLHGMNTVLHWGTNWNSSYESQRAAADSALRNGLKYIPSIHYYAVKGMDGYPLELIDAQVDNLWYHPAMLGWYVADEPELSLNAVYPSRLQMIYNRIRLHDFSAYPQFVVYCRPNEWYLRSEPPKTHDVMMSDVYPVMQGSIEFGNDLWVAAKTTRQQVMLSKISNRNAQISVVQACGVNGWGGFRLPTLNEQRYLSYAPIINGARGILWWDYGDPTDTVYEAASAEYKANIIAPIAQQIKSLIPAIVSNYSKVVVSSDSDTDTMGHGIMDISYMTGYDGNSFYLFAVNNTNATRSVTFMLSGFEFGITFLPEVLFENRNTVLIHEGNGIWKLGDSFEPYGVHVYKINESALPQNCNEAIAQGYSLSSDINKDCRVDLRDISVLSENWLSCIDPCNFNCEQPWN